MMFYNSKDIPEEYKQYFEPAEIGLEEHPQEYINKIVEVMKECKRVLKPTGTIFLNLGDSYYTKSGSGQGNNFLERHKQLSEGREDLKKAHTETRGKFKSNWLQSKQRLLIPYRIAIACQDELGLILRNDINWIKQWVNFKTKESAGASMPSSVCDRLNTNSETIFFFVKQKKYYFNLDAIRVPHNPKYEYDHNNKEERKGVNYQLKLGDRTTEGRTRNEFYNSKGKNPGDVIFSPTGKMQEENKEQIVSQKGLYEETDHTKPRFYNENGKNPGDCIMFPFEPSKEEHFAIFPTTLPKFCIKCGCPKDGIVLDPFAGFGTTLLVAHHMNINSIGIEISEKYCDLIQKRLFKGNKPLTNCFEIIK